VEYPGSIADPGCLSRIRIFSIPDSGSGVKKIPGSKTKIVSKLSEKEEKKTTKNTLDVTAASSAAYPKIAFTLK
jgi:hypothetical protein